MAPPLHNKAASGFIWSAIERFGEQIGVFVIQLLLARLLGPAEFGLVAMVGIFIALAGVVVDSGFGHALIQRKEITDTYCSTVFYLNFGLGVFVYLLLVLASPLVAPNARIMVVPDNPLEDLERHLLEMKQRFSVLGRS